MEKVETMDGYNEIVLQHFQSPSNIGEIKEPDGVGEYASNVCADVIRLYLKVSDNRIIDAKFQCFGCAGSLACGSMLTKINIGKEIEIAERVKEDYCQDDKRHLEKQAAGR